ncbi:MAG: hypothetical protein NTZ01_01425 [Verrucomicrobia bacterium]|nr:hypothetical protein [Verrucomicrobiota bacterium]
MFKSGPPRRIHSSFNIPSPVPASPIPPPSENLTPPSPKAWRHFVGWIGAAVLLLLAGSFSLYFLLSGSSYSKNDDEIRSPQALQAEYARWSSSLRALSKLASENNIPAFPILPPAVALDSSTLGGWTRWKKLPPDGLARSVLLRRLPQQVELIKLTPRRLITSEDGVSIDYAITLRSKEDILLAPVVPVAAPKDLSANHRRLLPKVVYAYDLPPGKVFDLTSSKTVLPAGTTLEGGWTLRRAERDSGTWKATSADLLPLTRIPALESIFVREATTPPPALLRSRGELENGEAKRRAAAQSLEDRLTAIREDVKQYRSQLMSSAPASVKSKGFGAGSGVPTGAGVGMVGGGAAGAGIGAMAGGGDGAAIGAGAGAFAGMLVGALIAHSEHEKQVEQEKAARRAAVAAIEREITEYERRLLREFENELTQEGTKQESTLNRPTPTN